MTKLKNWRLLHWLVHGITFLIIAGVAVALMALIPSEEKVTTTDEVEVQTAETINEGEIDENAGTMPEILWNCGAAHTTQPGWPFVTIDLELTEGQVGYFYEFEQAGFKFMSGCIEEETGEYGFILSRQKFEPLPNNKSLICDGYCDETIFLTGTKIDRLSEKLSGHEFGFYAEAYGQYCNIDRLAKNDLNQTLFFLRCGNGEAGGVTNLGVYNFSTDEYISVKDNEGVKRSDLLSQFRNTQTVWDDLDK